MGTGYTGGQSVVQTSDGGFIIAGYDGTPMSGINIYLLKTDGDGIYQWSKTVDAPFNQLGRDIAITSDGGFVVAGHTGSSTPGNIDVLLVKFNSNGDTLWSKTYGGLQNDYGYSVVQSNDGGFVIAGSYDPGVFGSNARLYLIKTDVNGDTLWTRVDTTFSSLAFSLTKTSSGDFVACGFVADSVKDFQQYIVAFDNNGNSLWSTTIGGDRTDAAYSIQQTSDLGFILTGYYNSIWDSISELSLLKLDMNGDSMWLRTFPQLSAEVGLSAIETFDGGYIIGGKTSLYSSYYDDLYLIKTNDVGIVGTEEYWDGRNEVVIYPNPATDQLTISFSSEVNENYSLVIVNLLGQSVKMFSGTSNGSLTVNTGKLSAGAYLYRLSITGKPLAQGKIIIQ
jgi:hypothetical protein